MSVDCQLRDGNIIFEEKTLSIIHGAMGRNQLRESIQWESRSLKSY